MVNTSSHTSQNAPTILICDDDQDSRSILQLTLSAQGYRVVEAAGAAEAIEQCALQLPDAIVMDILMPEMSGIEFVRWFRSTYTEVFVPVLLLTALTEVENRVEGLQAGADDYITKPFHHRELVARVDAALRMKELTRTLQNQGKELAAANSGLIAAQQALIQKERELAVMQLAGAAAHNLRQPVTSILLTCHLLEQRLKSDIEEKHRLPFQEILATVRRECQFMESIIASMSVANPDNTEPYLGQMTIVALNAPPRDGNKK